MVENLIKYVGRGQWFVESLYRRVGNGENTSFWNDRWMSDGSRLRDRFSRLFSLEVNKKCSVAERLRWVKDRLVGQWDWRRCLFEWEYEQVIVLSDLLCRCAPFSL